MQRKLDDFIFHAFARKKIANLFVEVNKCHAQNITFMSMTNLYIQLPTGAWDIQTRMEFTHDRPGSNHSVLTPIFSFYIVLSSAVTVQCVRFMRPAQYTVAQLGWARFGSVVVLLLKQ